MDFISLTFIIFLLATLVLYFVVGILESKFRKPIPQWSVLLVASILFYGLANWTYLIYLGISSVVAYVAGLLVQYKFLQKDVTEENVYYFCPAKVENHKSRKRYEKAITAFAIIINVGILAILKYYNFFASAVNSVFRTNLAIKNFIIPLGISFYTFSLISYNVDCYRRENEAEKNPFKFLLFVSYFPKIIQGPISTFKKLKDDGLYSLHSFKDIDYGRALFRISVGLIKKLAIANVLGVYVDAVYLHTSSVFGFELILISVFYTIQLYCDFSGFMDIALGISLLFGIKLEENFNIPYVSLSIQEFWRRWHITLGNWLKKYIYIPLGGNRVKIWRWIVNTLIVWLVSGLWHGADLTFVFWGLIHGAVLVIEGLPKQLKKSKGLETNLVKQENAVVKLLRWVLTLVIVDVSWVFFRSQNLPQAFEFISNSIMFWRGGAYSPFLDETIRKGNWLLIVSACMIFVLILLRFYSDNHQKIILKCNWLTKAEAISRYAITICFFSFAIFMFFYTKSLGAGGSSFIYFDF